MSSIKHKGDVCLIRTDGSKQLGLGHIMRSLAFAEGLERVGTWPVFVTRDYESQIIGKIKNHGCLVEPLAASLGIQEDLNFTVFQIRQYGAKFVVTDLCNVDMLEKSEDYRQYLLALKREGIFLIIVDDLNTFPLPADILINPNYGAEELSYQRSNGTRYLLGPKYFIFRQEFVRTAGKARRIRELANRILVTFGGGDSSSVLQKILKCLIATRWDPPLEIILVPGLEVQRNEKLRELTSNLEGSCQFVGVDCDMAELMLWSDIALIAGGLTKYEAAVTGTPSIILAYDGHQRALSKAFSREGAAIYLGTGKEVEESQIIQSVRHLLGNHSLRLSMSHAGKQLVDGKGLERILETLPVFAGRHYP